MKLITVMSFVDEFQKIASDKLELAGLGLLAAHPLKRMIKGKSDAEDKMEVAGLGTLAYPAAKRLLKR